MTPDIPRRCDVFRLATAHPADTGALSKLIASGTIRARDIRAIFGKTEGNGCVNDFTRAYAVSALRNALAGPLGCSPDAVGERIAMIMSGGTEGGLSPHLLVLPPRSHQTGGAVRTAWPSAPPLPRLPAGADRPCRADRGDSASGDRGNAQAGISAPDDVHYVQVKCPLLTSERAAQAASRGHTVVTADSYKSMGFSRGASALGVALALREVDPGALDDHAVCRRLDLWSSRASTSAGIELMHNEVIVLGNSPYWRVTR